MKKNNKSSFKKFLFLNFVLQIIVFIFFILVVVTTSLIIYENKRMNLFLINETNLLANIKENSRLYEIISLNKNINDKASIVFRDPISKYEIFYTSKPYFDLSQFDKEFLDRKNGIIVFKYYKIFFSESFLSRVCIIIVPKMIFYKNTIKIIFLSLIIFIFICIILALLLSQIDRKISSDLTKQYIFMKYLLEGKYKENELISNISEIDNIRYGLNNLVKILIERREFYNSLIIFQKKVLDLIPVGIMIFNEKGYFEDANNFGYAQIKNEIDRKNIKISEEDSIINEKFTIDSIISEDSLHLLNENTVTELKIKPGISFTKRVFGRILSKKKIIILVPLNISVDEESDEDSSYFKQALISFISDFAHELRSPLNSIIGFSQIIKDGIEGDNIEEIIKDSSIINQSAQIMMSFIDDIIFLSRLGKKNFDSYPVNFELKDLVSLINYYFKGIFKNKETTLNFPMDLTAKSITADFQSIRRIVLLFLFYLRSTFPLPKNIDIYFTEIDDKTYILTIDYFFNSERIEYQKISSIIYNYCEKLAKTGNLDINNQNETRKNGKFTIKFKFTNDEVI